MTIVAPYYMYQGVKIYLIKGSHYYFLFGNVLIRKLVINIDNLIDNGLITNYTYFKLSNVDDFKSLFDVLEEREL